MAHTLATPLIQWRYGKLVDLQQDKGIHFTHITKTILTYNRPIHEESTTKVFKVAINTAITTPVQTFANK